MSSFDSRYPWLHRINSAPMLSHSDRKEAARVAKRILDNTGLQCAFNARTGDLFFYYRSPHGGPFSMPFYDRDERTVRRYDDSEIGDYIRLAKLGQLDASEKSRIAERNEKTEKSRHRAMLDKHAEDRTPAMKNYADFLKKKRRGTTKLVSV